ncbi:hypothetical protein [Flavobacterium coralii]|uniref:hypothetical protein n=1 Tax=Flavobacterium coralii TaxID=2838017 RepID=UPI000C639CEF|nr:hypothetical protein [Flavobacterium sp.]|tara:strand:+ start:3020 stop:3619 length:600 start_codon:yes stop_codon:yes gene_type:complete
MKKLYFILSLLFSFSLYSQTYEGKITLDDGNIITGMVEMNYDTGINLVNSKNEIIEEIPAENIKSAEINVDGEVQRYVYLESYFATFNFSKQTNLKIRMMQILSEGPKVTVLEYRPTVGLLTMTELTYLYLLKTGSQTPVMYSSIQRGSIIKPNYKRYEFKEFAMEFFADCPALIEKIASEEYDARESIEIAEMYNNCN